MRILQVVSCFPPAYAFGGPVKVAYQIAGELVKRKHEVVVYTSDAKDLWSRLSIDPVEVVDGIRVHYFRNLALTTVRRSKLFITPRVVSRAREEVESFDVIHFHEYRTFQNIVVHHYARKYNIPYILQAHGSIPRIGREGRKWLYDAFFGYKILKDASRVIALSKVEAEQYKDMGVLEDKIAIIPNGIGLSEYENLPPQGGFRAKYGISEDKKIILYLGRIHKVKGIDFLIEAYARLVKDSRFNDALLVIAGPDDGYLNEARSLVRSLGMSGKVIFTGWLTEYDKISAFVDSSFAVFPERFNVFLLVPLEAAACGKPVIVSSTNYISHVVKEGGFGFSVKYSDTAGLAEIMEKMLSNDDLLKETGDRGRKFVFKNFNWSNIITRLEEVYGEAVQNVKQHRCEH